MDIIRKVIRRIQISNYQKLVETNGNKPVHAINYNTKAIIIDLYKTKYYSANFTHYSKFLISNEHISIAPNTVRSILRGEYSLSQSPSCN